MLYYFTSIIVGNILCFVFLGNMALYCSKYFGWTNSYEFPTHLM